MRYPSAISKTDVEKEMKGINPQKSYYQKNNIPLRILRERRKVLSNFLQKPENNATSGEFPGNLKLADVAPVFKKKNPWIKQVIDKLVFYQQFRKTLKNSLKDN